ncbi:MAG: acyl carrier protein [Planctomycetota bacterium]|nr:MAG: acyl carrier protein [Planctomycetota bacterium]
MGKERTRREHVAATVDEILRDEFEVEAEQLKPEAPLAELGLDSLDGVDLVVAIEKAFSLRIPEAEARSIRTLEDIYERVERRLEELEGAV